MEKFFAHNEIFWVHIFYKFLGFFPIFNHTYYRDPVLTHDIDNSDMTQNTLCTSNDTYMLDKIVWDFDPLSSATVASLDMFDKGLILSINLDDFHPVSASKSNSANLYQKPRCSTIQTLENSLK